MGYDKLHDLLGRVWKMREQFEKIPAIAELLREATFDEETGEYDSYWAYKSGYLNGAWYSFQEVHKELEAQQKIINDLKDAMEELLK